MFKQKFKNNIGFIALTVFVVIIYILTLRGLPGNLYPTGTGKYTINTNIPPFETSLERGRYAQVITIAEEHTFVIDKFKDFVVPDVAWNSGHYFSAFPPGPSVLSVPLYLIGQSLNLSQVFTFSLSTIFSVLTAIVIILIGKRIRLSKRAIAICVIIYSFASASWAYGVTLSAHPISAFLISLAFLVTLWIKKDKSNFFKFLLLWSIFGLNFYIDYPNLLILLPLIIYAYLKLILVKDDENKYKISIPIASIFGVISFILVLIPFILFNYNYFHKPIAFTNTYNLKALEVRGIKFSYNNLSNSLFNQKAYSTRFNVDTLPNGIETLLLSNDRGLLFFFPIYLFAFFGLVISYIKREKIWLIIFVMFAANLFVYGTFDDPYGGWSFGPRYLIPTLPLLTILLGTAYDFIKKNIYSKLIFSLLFLYSCFVAISGALTTNAVPPSVENIPNTPVNFILNIRYLLNNKSSSFVYNILFSPHISAMQYCLILFLVITTILFFVVWFPEKKEKYD